VFFAFFAKNTSSEAFTQNSLIMST